LGTDWYRMRLRPGAGDVDLPVLIRQQAVAFRASGSLWDDFGHLTGEAAERVAGAHGPPLSAYVQVDADAGNSRRVAGIVLNPIFPAEWRLAACRSFLPAELPSQLRQWETHVDEVRAGGHRDYLYAWYCYEVARQLAQQWQPLRELASAARDRRNSWAVRPELISVREEVLALPPPATPPAPAWGAAVASVIPPDEDGARRLALAREWNRRVPSGQKVLLSRIPDFGQYLANALDSPWHANCLTWIHRAAEQGYGLLLDW
jgi:hypothetical protein